MKTFIYKKRNYVPMIFCIYDEDDIVAILPLERLLGNSYYSWQRICRLVKALFLMKIQIVKN